MAVFVDSFDISNARVYCWALRVFCSIWTQETREEIQEGEMEYMTIHGRFTRDELMDMEGWSDYDMMDYTITEEESLDDFLGTLRDDDL